MSNNGWEPIESAPKKGRLLLGARWSNGYWHTVCGRWVPQWEIDEQWEDPDAFEEGWYEISVNADEPNCWPTPATHWMPLPAPPETADGR